MKPWSIKSEKMHPCRQLKELKGDKREPIGAKMEPKDAKKVQTGAKGTPKGPQREPKGAKGSPKGAQREPKGAKREPNGVQNASKSGSKLDLRKTFAKSHQNDSKIDDFWNHVPSKIHVKNDAKNIPKMLGKNMNK